MSLHVIFGGVGVGSLCYYLPGWRSLQPGRPLCGWGLKPGPFFFFFLLYLQPAIDSSTPAVVKIPLVHKTWKIASEHSC